MHRSIDSRKKGAQKLPSTRFFRRQGIYTDTHFDLDGNVITEAEYEARKYEWIPSPEDRAYVASLMTPVYEPGKVANWIAPPSRGIGGQKVEFEYVRV